MSDVCFVCGEAIPEGERLVLVRGQRHQAHCSHRCLGENVRAQRLARTAAQRRWALRSSAVVLLLFAATFSWHRFRAPQPQSISYDVAAEVRDEAPPMPPPLVGPPWPPTDEDWTRALESAQWVHPLPGPHRRAPVSDDRLFGPEPSGAHRPRCRTAGICGVDLGGELWGEHVYASLDGVVDLVQAATDERRGGISVRLAHLDGTVFTQYFHLAATRRHVTRGARIKSGELIGLLGDTGLPNGARHLHFTLSVRASYELPEVYWDPTPILTRAALRLPPHGTVAGLAPAELSASQARRRRGR